MTAVTSSDLPVDDEMSGEARALAAIMQKSMSSLDYDPDDLSSDDEDDEESGKTASAPDGAPRRRAVRRNSSGAGIRRSRLKRTIGVKLKPSDLGLTKEEFKDPDKVKEAVKKWKKEQKEKQAAEEAAAAAAAAEEEGEGNPEDGANAPQVVSRGVRRTRSNSRRDIKTQRSQRILAEEAALDDDDVTVSTTATSGGTGRVRRKSIKGRSRRLSRSNSTTSAGSTGSGKSAGTNDDGDSSHGGE